MLSSKLLPEMETEEAAMKEHLLGGMTNLPVPLQTEKLQVRYSSNDSGGVHLPVRIYKSMEREADK